MKRGIPILLLLSCASPAVIGGSAELPDLIIGDHVFERRQLTNGLRALAIQDSGDTTTVFMAISAGTRNETPETTGLAHLTEHAMFAGTPTTGTDLHEKTIVDWGGESNAFTRDDYTMYYDHNFPPEKLSIVLDMEADRLRNLSLDEKPTLHERWRLKVEEEHSYQASEGRAQELENAVYRTHPYRHGLRDAKGHTKAIDLPVSEIRKFYDRHYQPNRVAIVVVGPHNPQSALDAVESAFSSIPRGEAAPQYLEPKVLSPRSERLESELPRDRNLRVWITPPMGSAQRPALDVLASMLGREELPSGVPLSVGLGGRVGQDMFSFSWSSDEASSAQTEEEVRALVASYRNQTANTDCFSEVKELLRTSYLNEPLRARPYFALAGTVAWHESYGLGNLIADYANAVDQVTPSDVWESAKSVLSDERCISVVFAGTGEAFAPLPNDPQGLRSAAAEAQETGDIDRALEAYGRLLEVMPDKMNTVINYAERGMLLMEVKNFDAAIADFEAALEVIDYPAVRELLEEAHARKGRAMRGEFEEVESVGLQEIVDSTMDELEEWRGLSFTGSVVPEFVDVSDSPDEKLGGWYEPDTKRLVVVTGKDDSGANFTRGAQLHEIFHALQDQTWDLTALDSTCETTDQIRALQGLIEGEAMLAVSDLMNYDFAQHSQIPETGEIDRAKFEKLFNYGVGLSFVKNHREEGGWSAIDEIWRNIPQSTSELYHPHRYPSFYSDSMMFEPEGEILEVDCLGEFELRWLLVQDERTRHFADPLGNALLGDAWFKVTPPGADHQHEVWALRFSDSEMAKLFAGAKVALERESWTVNQQGPSVVLTREAQ
ncbi:MAG: insulinase family protein [Planctomycetota bacterium]|jgi:predicted Zn-dependent peptidase|nr:insulinase family protein [Planctomycetota bacterium]MDP6941999.1 insulinase family protein [Planctomycetota bacterium]